MKKIIVFVLLLISLCVVLYCNDWIQLLLGNKELQIKEINLVLVECSVGSFKMGSPEDEFARELENYGNEKLHSVTLTKPFYIGKYEVTQSQYETIMGENPSEVKGPNNPVEVPYNDAKIFCFKLNQKYKDMIPKGYLFDLPTEAQWEYACRAGTNTALNNGKNLTSSNGVCDNLDKVAWYNNNSNKSTHTVGQKKPNAWGIYDMHGNVAEWCRDYCGDYSNKDIIDPVGINYDKRCIRGGAWNNNASYCRSASRLSSDLYDNNNAGFRIVLRSIDEVESEKLLLKNKDDLNCWTLASNIDIKMVECPSGSFIMGSPEKELGRDKDEILHKEIIHKPFYIGKFEVTQSQYKKIMGGKLYPNSDFVPEVYVNWHISKSFCKKLNLRYKYLLLQKGFVFDLPTEAQWEYACRAGTTTALNNGKNLTSDRGFCPNLDEVAWYYYGDYSEIHPVGQKKPNAWGIYDMHGNVAEWCLGGNNNLHPIRGGSWADFAGGCRSANTGYWGETELQDWIGFRVALVPVE